jgi:hypothetical protein
LIPTLKASIRPGLFQARGLPDLPAHFKPPVALLPPGRLCYDGDWHRL